MGRDEQAAPLKPLQGFQCSVEESAACWCPVPGVKTIGGSPSDRKCSTSGGNYGMAFMGVLTKSPSENGSDQSSCAAREPLGE